MSEQERKMTLRDTIVPKSDQLNYDDVATTPLTVTVTGMAMGSEDQPVVVKCDNAATGEKLRPYKPCKSMRRVLIAVWGDEGRSWIGKQMTLVGDSSVMWGGQRIGGIRVSAVSGIDKPQTIMLTVTRGKRSPYTVEPITTKKDVTK